MMEKTSTLLKKDMDIAEAIALLGERNDIRSMKVSIFLPTHPQTNTQNLQQDRIRIKNALREAKLLLTENSQIAKTINNASTKLLSDAFITNLSTGLALFIEDDHVYVVNLPIEVHSHVNVGHQFLIEPLHMIVNSFSPAYIVDVNLHQPRLFYGDISHIIQKNVPLKTFDELLELDHSANLQFYTTRGSNGNQSTNFHGHGAKSDQKEADINYYLKYALGELRPLLKDDAAPVILAGEKRSIIRAREHIGIDNKRLFLGDTGSIQHLNAAEVHDVVKDLLVKEGRLRYDHHVKLLPDSLVTGLTKSLRLISLGRAKNIYIPSLLNTTDSVRSGLQSRYILNIPSDQKILKAMQEGLQKGAKLFAVDAQQFQLDSLAVQQRY